MTAEKTKPSLMLRLAVVVGSVTLLLGMTGLVFLLIRGDVGSRIQVVIEGLPEDARCEVQVQWKEGTSLVTQDAHPGEEPGVWVLPPIPPSTPATILVQEADTRPPRVLKWAEVAASPAAGRIVLSITEPPADPESREDENPR